MNAKELLSSIDEKYLQTKNLKDMYKGGGVKQLRSVLRTALHIADSILDENNKEFPVPVSMEDKDRVKASRVFIDSALKRLRGITEYYYDTFKDSAEREYTAGMGEEKKSKEVK